MAYMYHTCKVHQRQRGRAIERQRNYYVAPGWMQPDVLPKGSKYHAPLQTTQGAPQRRQQQHLSDGVPMLHI